MIATALEHAMFDLLVAECSVNVREQPNGAFYEVTDADGNIITAGYDQANVLIDAHVRLDALREEANA